MRFWGPCFQSPVWFLLDSTSLPTCSFYQTERSGGQSGLGCLGDAELPSADWYEMLRCSFNCLGCCWQSELWLYLKNAPPPPWMKSLWSSFKYLPSSLTSVVDLHVRSNPPPPSFPLSLGFWQSGAAFHHFSLPPLCFCLFALLPSLHHPVTVSRGVVPVVNVVPGLKALISLSCRPIRPNLAGKLWIYIL